jgi:hypothetical protein
MNTKRPMLVFFLAPTKTSPVIWVGKPVPEIQGKLRREIGRSQTLPWWLGGGGIKTTENKIHWPPLGRENRGIVVFFQVEWLPRMVYVNLP